MGTKAVWKWVVLGVLAALQCACASSSGTLQPPQVQLTGLSLLQPSQRFRVSLLLTNSNAESVPVDALRFSIRLGGEGLLNGKAAATVTVAANAVETLRVDVEGDTVSSVSRLIAMQGPTGALPYEIAGDLTLNRKAYSFNSAGQVPFSTTADR